ncbi:hypothetical protein GV794_11080 [Nocardia cyriacigeorgica]|uniref:Uncharacterized protein n=1 Tax=Nocardia cyriacigeorgica TaxID=135487 RepID=A0A6P1DBA3_9NOCA|nr:hypothetical protein [Nocardia cyriacigeorgica]NEW37808.1 hypothetical protein [Nocardia cyriacigeorgica]NEW45592.1 hypothetical protein [Nocardia cyriacigeorgica]NEW48807.1 hypothetical protein [Nocardia cyriacigeorgica]NEW56189.1 hypothetical protein [Nocardia cyriacigeorgica]
MQLRPLLGRQRRVGTVFWVDVRPELRRKRTALWSRSCPSAIHANGGDVYSAEEATDWLHATGWRYLDRQPLAGPISVIVAETA